MARYLTLTRAISLICLFTYSRTYLPFSPVTEYMLSLSPPKARARALQYTAVHHGGGQGVQIQGPRGLQLEGHAAEGEEREG